VQTYVIDPGASNPALDFLQQDSACHGNMPMHAIVLCLVDKLRLQSTATNKSKNHLSPKMENVSINENVAVQGRLFCTQIMTAYFVVHILGILASLILEQN